MSEAYPDSIRRVFLEGFVARDVAEPLVSFDQTADAASVRRLMDERGFDVVGLRDGGLVAGYVLGENLVEGPCGAQLCPIDPQCVLEDTASLSEVIRRLSEHPRVFVRCLGVVSGIVTRDDLEKPPVRMWLFGLVTLIEMVYTRAIRRRFPGEEWTALLPEGRIEKARAIQEERQRRQQARPLLDCLQIADKGLITLKDEELFRLVGYISKTRGQRTIKELESLRNNLAHSQDIVSYDWEAIVKLAENLERIVEIAGRRKSQWVPIQVKETATDGEGAGTPS